MRGVVERPARSLPGRPIGIAVALVAPLLALLRERGGTITQAEATHALEATAYAVRGAARAPGNIAERREGTAVRLELVEAGSPDHHSHRPIVSACTFVRPDPRLAVSPPTRSASRA